jgi:hypothetical protein
MSERTFSIIMFCAVGAFVWGVVGQIPLPYGFLVALAVGAAARDIHQRVTRRFWPDPVEPGCPMCGDRDCTRR